MIETIETLPAGFHPEFFRETESFTAPEIRREGMTVYFPAFVRAITNENDEYGITVTYRYFDVPVPFTGQDLTNEDEFAFVNYAAIRKFFYGTQEMQAELRDDFVWEAHRQAVRSAFPKAAGAVNELAQRFKVIKATFWAAVDEVCSKVGKTRVDLPVSGGFNAEQMVTFAIENGMSAADIASYTSKFAIISLNLLQNNRNWDELFVDIPAPAATETTTETTEATTTTTAENGEE